nr:MAG TPA: zonular occludens toxin [Inoviridae sp.]
MKLLIVVALIVFIWVYVPIVPFVIKHFYYICINGAVDLYKFFKHKEYNRCEAYGRIYMITAYRNKVFGSGKTLDMTMVARGIYNRYNGLPVWNEDKQAFVTQNIHLISNVELLDVPYTPFVSAEQLKNVEQEEDDITIFVFDEVGAIWNSRNYKDNINTELLKRLLQVRKNKIGIICTAQRFKFVDALLRQITGSLYCVNKTWRILSVREYDAVSFENCDNIDMIKPISKGYKFVFNKDYAAYDTSAIVEDLKKADMLTDAEVLAAQGVVEPNIDFATGIKKRYRKRKR